MKKCFLHLALTIVAASAHAQQAETIPVATTFADSDVVTIIKDESGQKKWRNVSLGLLRLIPASKISDATVIGKNLVTAANPGAVRYLRANADNTVTWLSPSGFASDLGAANINAVINSTVAPAWPNISSKPTTIPGYGITDATKRPQTIIWIGDSLVASNSTFDGNSTRYYRPNGFFVWGNAMMGWPFDFVNAGVNGNTSQDVLNRLAADVLTPSPGYAGLLIGTNDLANGVTVAALMTNITSIVDQMLAKNIVVAIATIPPRADIDALIIAANNEIRELGRDRGLVLIDFDRYLRDPATDDPVTGYTVDGIHWTSTGAFMGGRAVRDGFEAAGVRLSSLVGGGNAGAIFSNLNFVGDSSGLATGWTKSSAAGTASKVAIGNGRPGEWQQLSYSNSSAYSFLYSERLLAGSGVAVGDWVRGSVVARTWGQTTNANMVDLQVVFRDGSNNITGRSCCLMPQSGDGDLLQVGDLSQQLTLVTAWAQVPVNTTKIQFLVTGYKGPGGNMTAKYQFRNGGFYKQ